MDFDPGRFVNQSSAINSRAKLSQALTKQAQMQAAQKAALTRALQDQAAKEAAGLGAVPSAPGRFAGWGVDDPVASVLAAAPGTGMIQTQPSAYVDPAVNNTSVPPSIAVQQRQPVARTGPNAPGILSAPTATRAGVFEQGALSRNPGMFSLIGPVDKIDRQEATYGKVGGFAGGLLGSLVGGPVGGLLGAFAGRSVGKSAGANGGFGKGSTGSGKGSSGGKGAEGSGRSNGAGSRAGERSGWAGR